MSVLLRHPGIGLYYAGPRHWAGDRASALDLESVERATEISRQEDFTTMEIVVSSDQPGRELVLPLKPRIPPQRKDVDRAA
jgi:hypothetical protein